MAKTKNDVRMVLKKEFEVFDAGLITKFLEIVNCKTKFKNYEDLYSLFCKKWKNQTLIDFLVSVKLKSLQEYLQIYNIKFRFDVTITP